MRHKAWAFFFLFGVRPLQLFYLKHCTLILSCVRLLLPRLRASLDNIFIHPAKRHAFDSGWRPEKDRDFVVASDALRRPLFTPSPLQTGGCGWIPGPTSLSQLLKLTLTSGLALTLLNPQAPLHYWGWQFIRGDGPSQVSLLPSGDHVTFFSFPWGAELKCWSGSWPRVRKSWRWSVIKDQFSPHYSSILDLFQKKSTVADLHERRCLARCLARCLQPATTNWVLASFLWASAYSRLTAPASVAHTDTGDKNKASVSFSKPVSIHCTL